MNPLIRPALLLAALLIVAGCSNKPAADPADSGGVEIPSSSSDAPSRDKPANEPYPGAQPADGRSAVTAYPEPDADSGETDADADDAETEDREEDDEAGADQDADATSSGTFPDAGAAKMSLDETFVSESLGYAIDHPVDWFVDDSGSIAILRSEDDSDQPGRDGVPDTMTKIDIVQLEGFPLDIETRVSQIREELDEVVDEERFTLISGEAATWLRGSGGMAGDTGIVVTIVGGQLYQLQAYGNPGPLPAIAYTFRASE